MKLRVLVSVVALAAVACGGEAAPPRFIREIPWQGRGVWLKADAHVHTDDFSDGGYVLKDVVAKAAEHGCDVLAVTDHLDVNLTAATPEYFAAIETARNAHPQMTILAGGEWNIPPWGGDEHVTVLLSPAAERQLSEFKRLFDDHRRPTHDAELATEALRWLAANASPAEAAPVLIYEHPSRKDFRSADNVADVRAWRAVNDLVIGFAGAPGHQGLPPYGDYNVEREPTIDRWDPAVARIGDAWDTLLGQGLDVWGAHVASDFHSDKRSNDHAPCQFGATWLYAPSRDANGVLQAFRAGSFFAEHGGIARDVELHVSAPRLARPATAGEVIAVAPETTLTVRLRFVVPEEAWDGGPNRIDRVQIIAIDESGARIEYEGGRDEAATFTHSLQVPKGGVVLRARGYREVGGDRLAFYTNPVRVITE